MAYVEAMATFARRHLEGRLDAEQVKALVAQLNRPWPDVVVVAVDEVLAARLILKHCLRGFDAVRSAAAAKAEGLTVL